MQTEGISLVSAGMANTVAPKNTRVSDSTFDSFMTKHAARIESSKPEQTVDRAEKVSISASSENSRPAVEKSSAGNAMKGLSTSVKDNLKQDNKAYASANDNGAPETVDLTSATEQAMASMREIFGLSEEDLVDIMEQLGIGVADLLFQLQGEMITPIDVQTIKQMVMGVHGIVDEAVFLTSEKLTGEMSRLQEQFTDVLSEMFGVAPEELDAVGESLTMDFQEQLQTWMRNEQPGSEEVTVGMPAVETPETDVKMVETPDGNALMMERPVAEAASADMLGKEVLKAEVPAAEVPEATISIPETLTTGVEMAVTEQPKAEVPMAKVPVVDTPVAEAPVETAAAIVEEMPVQTAEASVAEQSLTNSADIPVKAVQTTDIPYAVEETVVEQKEAPAVIVEDFTGTNTEEASEKDTASQGSVTAVNPDTDSGNGESHEGGMADGQQDVQGRQTMRGTILQRHNVRSDTGAELFVERLTEAFRETSPTGSAPAVSMTHIVEQIVNQIRIRVMPETTNMELQLHPASLGRVNLQVSSMNGVARATMIVESQVAKEALESQMITLKETFAEQGLKVDSVEVTVSDFGLEHNQGQNEEQANQNAKDRKFRPEAGLEQDSEESENSMETASERRDVNSVVDYTA